MLSIGQARDLTATTSKFWGVSWHKDKRRWQVMYRDVNGKQRSIGYFDTQEDAARAYNAAIRALPPAVQRRRLTNPIVNGQLVTRARKASGHGADYLRGRRRKRGRRDEPAAAAPSTRPRN